MSHYQPAFIPMKGVWSGQLSSPDCCEQQMRMVCNIGVSNTLEELFGDWVCRRGLDQDFSIPSHLCPIEANSASLAPACPAHRPRSWNTMTWATWRRSWGSWPWCWTRSRLSWRRGSLRTRVGASSGVGECWSSSSPPCLCLIICSPKISEDYPGG